MPIWNDPPRRLIDAIKRVRGENASRRGEQIELHEIDAVQGRDSYLIKGRVVKATGEDTGLRVGQQVPVVVKQGEPKVILAHSARRAQLGPGVPPGGVQSIIEELLIAGDPQGEPPVSMDIWFRNDQQVTNLNIVGSGALQGNTPTDIVWGQQRDAFVVVTGNDPAELRYYTFTIKRNISRVLGATKPVVTFQGVRAFADISVQLSQINFQFDRNSRSPIPHEADTAGVGNSFVGLFRHTDIAHQTESITIRLDAGTIQTTESGGASKRGTIALDSVTGPTMDNARNVYVTAILQFNNFGCTPVGDVGLSGARENFVGLTCDTITVPPESFDRFSDVIEPYFVIQQQHMVLINVTSGSVVFSSLKSGITLTALEALEGWREKLLDGRPTQNIVSDGAPWLDFPFPWTLTGTGFPGGGSYAYLTFEDGINPNTGLVITKIRWRAQTFGAAGNGGSITFNILGTNPLAPPGFSQCSPVGPPDNTFVASVPPYAAVTNVAGSSVTIEFAHGWTASTFSTGDPDECAVLVGTTTFFMQRAWVTTFTIADAFNSNLAAKAVAQVDFLNLFNWIDTGTHNFVGGTDGSAPPDSTCALFNGAGIIPTDPQDVLNESIQSGQTGDWGISSSGSALYNELVLAGDQQLNLADIRRVNILWIALLGVEVGVQYFRASVVSRFEPRLSVTPFYARNGTVRLFVVLTLFAKKPANVAGATLDASKVGVFVILTSATPQIITLRELSDSDDDGFFLAGNGQRLLWSLGDNVFMSDLVTSVTKQVGSDEEAFREKLNAWLTNPDFLLNAERPKTPPVVDEVEKAFFVNGWNRRTRLITLDQNNVNVEFPPKDALLSTAAGQKDLPDGMRATIDGRHIQTINDKTILSTLGVNLTDA